MPIRYQIVPERNLVVFTVEGQPTIEDYFEIWERVYADAGFKKDMHTVWDIRNGTLTAIKNGDVYAMRDAILQNVDRRGDCFKIAAVVKTDINLGVTRMFQTVGSNLPCKFEIFADYDKAIEYVTD
jgi:hypothetical protein